MDVLKIYEYALQREREGKSFFQRHAQRFGHAAAVDAFEKLAEEEQKHIEFIQSLIDAELAAVGLPAGTIDARGNGGPGSTTIYRLREGIERFLITDINNPAATAIAQSELAVMWDYIDAAPDDVDRFNHIPGGCNVLYADGHVEFLKYPGEHPVHPATAATGKGW